MPGPVSVFTTKFSDDQSFCSVILACECVIDGAFINGGCLHIYFISMDVYFEVAITYCKV